jgi:hypothetical protein
MVKGFPIFWGDVDHAGVLVAAGRADHGVAEIGQGGVDAVAEGQVPTQDVDGAPIGSTRWISAWSAGPRWG